MSGYNNKSVGNVTSSAVTGLAASTKYYYRVRASNSYGASGNSSTITVTTSAAGSASSAPVAAAATSITTSSFTANWAASSGATAYYLDVSTSSSFSWFVSGYNNLNVGNVTSYAVSGLSAGTAYYYQVRASNTDGTSDNSNMITVTSSAAGSQDFTITTQGATTTTVVPGSSVVFNLMVTPIVSGGGDAAAPLAAEGAILSSNLNLTYSSVPALPSGWTVVFSPDPITAGSGATAVTMTIQTALTTAAAKPSGALLSRLVPFSLALPFAGRLRRSGKRLGRMLSLLLLLGAGAAAVAGLSGCGSNTSFFAMAPQTYTVTVTGTTLSHTANTTATLTVE